MISIVLLLKLLGGISFILCLVYIWRLALRTERRMECLKEHYDARISAIARQQAAHEKQTAAHEGDTDGERTESRRKALEAERRFSEGIASILNFSPTSISAADVSVADGSAADAMASGDKTPVDSGTGRKGD
jgi:hypothetical protein